MPAEAVQFDQALADEDLAHVVLDAHCGDALAGLRSVIADAAFLHDQLEIASLLISPGLVRGWKPKFQRED
jgi:hypothetical protein